MRLADELRHKREEILRIAARHGAGNVAVFGSAARERKRPTVTSISSLTLRESPALGSREGSSRIWKSCLGGGSRLSSAAP